GLFVFAGVLLLGVTYVLLSNALPGDEGTAITGTAGPGSGQPALPAGSPTRQASPPPPRLLVNEIRGKTWHGARKALLPQGGIALAVVSAAAFALAWLIAGRLLQPLHRVTEPAGRIADAPAADRGLHERIALEGPHDEIKDLADTFDRMLER